MKVSVALTKICPFMTDNQGIYDEVITLCLCGDCMAWEYTKESQFKTINSRNKQMEEIAKKDGWEHFDAEDWIRELPEDEKEGYCKRLEQ